jgi:DNA repair protein RadC
MFPHDREIMVVLMLNLHHELIGEPWVVSVGNSGGLGLLMKDLYRKAVKDEADFLVMMHNHPSGKLLPSSEDMDSTRTALACGRLLGIPLLDHLIVREGDYVSLREQKMVKFE